MNTNLNPAPADPRPIRSSSAPSTPRRSRGFRFAALARWLHIYVSLFALTVVLFFSITGITLNHPNWTFGIRERQSELKGQLPAEWFKSTPPKLSPTTDPAALPKLEIVEFLRKHHPLSGSVEEFRADDRECLVSFKGPGYSADVFIQRETGAYQISEIRQGLVAILNDLHKGRHTGAAWAWIIDLTSAILILISLTGLVLLLYLKRRRSPGILAAIAGAGLLAATAWLLVP